MAILVCDNSLQKRDLQLGEIGSIMSTNGGDIRTQDGSQAPRLGQDFKIEGHLNTCGRSAPLDLAQVASAFQTGDAGDVGERKAERPSNGGKGFHSPKFAHAEQIDKPNVRHDRTDTRSVCLHIPNMADKPRKARHDLYSDYRERSGWYLAAWRDFAGLTLEDLAAELGKSKGYVSDLETGAPRPGRPPTRFNRDLVENAAKVVGTTGGRLIDVNPFEMSSQMERFSETIAKLDDEGRAAVIEMAERWLGRTGTSG